jgi:antitoxin PrlF
MRGESIMSTATVTSKGQVTIPADIRRALHIEVGDQLFFMVEGERGILVPAHRQSIMAFQGVLRVTAPYLDHQEIRDTIGRQRGEALNQERNE